LKIAEHRAFPDHHRFSAEDAADLVMRADEQGLALITTEKDRARMIGDPAAAALAQRAHVLPATMKFADEEAVRRTVSERIARVRG
jgi:tetraacyldisaccharide 4'-kinase